MRKSKKQKHRPRDADRCLSKAEVRELAAFLAGYLKGRGCQLSRDEKKK